MKILLSLILALSSFSAFSVTIEQEFEWFRSLEGKVHELRGSDECRGISFEDMMYDFGAGPNTRVILIRSESTDEELTRQGTIYHTEYVDIEDNVYKYKFKRLCTGDFNDGTCTTTMKLVKEGDDLVYMKIVELKQYFLVPVSRKVIKCKL